LVSFSKDIPVELFSIEELVSIKELFVILELDKLFNVLNNVTLKSIDAFSDD
jgi:hypothetical protein